MKDTPGAMNDSTPGRIGASAATGGRRRWPKIAAIPLLAVAAFAFIRFGLAAFEPFTIPSNSMSPTLPVDDHRDNSADSHVIGPVPAASLIGRAEMLLLSRVAYDNRSDRIFVGIR